MKKLGYCALAAAVAALMAFAWHLRQTAPEELRAAQKPYILLYGVHFLEDPAIPLLETLPEGCVLLGLTSRENPEAELYASQERSATPVYQDPWRPERLYADVGERDTGRSGRFLCYTLPLACCSLLRYGGALYIWTEDAHDLPPDSLTEARRPGRSTFAPVEADLFFGERSAIPRQEGETNDPLMAGAQLLASSRGTDYLLFLREGSPLWYARVLSTGIPDEAV